MKNCISCTEQIDDGAVFCPHCGAKQNDEQKKQFVITERAFCRIFRPSFFGGINIDNDTLFKFIVNFLSLQRALTKEDLVKINRAFDTMLNNAAKEYNLVENQRNKYEVNDKNLISETEELRCDFAIDSIFDIMKRFYGTEDNLKIEHFSNVWLFSLLSAFDGGYSSEKSRFFKRMKHIFPISQDAFYRIMIGHIFRDDANYEFASNLLIFVHNPKLQSARVLGKGRYSSTIRLKLTSDEIIEIRSEDLKNEVPPNFDFYAIVEEKTKKLCDLEYKIQELENSEGKYAEIADKIAELAREERSLTEKLPGFCYQKF